MNPLQTELRKVEERGTGKELLAHAIHDAGKRAHQPFVAVNCAAIYFWRPDEAAVESAVAKLGIELDAPNGAGTNDYMTDYPVIGSGCILRFADRPGTQVAA